MIDNQWTYIVWCAMALLLVGGGLVRVARQRPANSKAPGILASAAIWVGIILLIVLLYQGATFWTTLGSLFR